MVIETATRPVVADPAPPPHRTLLAVVGGLIAGVVTIGVAELLAGLVQRFGWSSGTPSPVLAVGSAFINHTPLWLKEFATSNFGTNDKKVLLGGIAVVLFVASLVIGWISERHYAVALVLFVALVAVAALAVATRPHAGFIDVFPLLIGAVAGLLMLGWWRLQLVVNPAPAQMSSYDRRRVLILGAGGAVAAALGGFAGRALSSGARAVEQARAAFVLPKVAKPVTVPAGASVGVPGVTPFVVPGDQFYRIDTALTVPEVDPHSWSLKVTGMVDHDIEIDWDTLLSKPMIDAMVTLMCVSNEVGGNLNGNAIWTGWPVRELLAQAGPQTGADMVLSTSVDGFTAGTPLSAMTDPNRNAILAVAMNGEALPAEHGFPVRLVVPGLYGYVSATKWLSELKVTTYAKDMGYWTPRGWSAMGPVKISSRIDVPTSGTHVKAGTVAVAGVAWDQHVGVKSVQVQVDGGAWQEARLGTDATIDAWRQWVYEWPATKGSHTIAVRAVSDTGEVQTSVQAPPAPNGSTGLDSITVTVD
ncbi:molybdopterin-dependent oxidoreductase [Rudaeicoccus suwonensis]|uniref:DMSO/TMAO reductase YedYZ molybdopterin-dependent catalytic subunit n=1 Tax=Rudaeicoccus suwonensis TaxID=657409 RepID=A0A561DWV3_9MICO|nr:molybdopterin-dependent oxidoreductase [Rudaeicoccus suwonensis]TWE07849.1 DMSO/TMAO reductase YedYZ molybdopterin-dependent catalytic subunit [Rudaeicoccus suwonensis]